LWPFPSEDIRKAAASAKAVLVVEMSAGQMIEDVRLALDGSKPVCFEGRTGGGVPTQKSVLQKIKETL
jgi:2-oxoglutarate ferredoxin oxidoreductase subunit alpha